MIYYDSMLYLHYVYYGTYWNIMGFNRPKQDLTNECLKWGRLTITSKFVAIRRLSNKFVSTQRFDTPIMDGCFY